MSLYGNSELCGGGAVLFVGRRSRPRCALENLKSLAFKHCGVTPLGLQALLELSSGAFAHLEDLELPDGVGDDGAKVLASTIEHGCLPSLRSLDL